MTNNGNGNGKVRISPETIVGDLLKDYPELEDKLIEIAPVFKKLQNPFLRKTVAKVTSLKQAAVVGNVSLSLMINTLREASGQEKILEIKETGKEQNTPDWINKYRTKMCYDAGEDIENGVHPASKIISEISQLEKEEMYLLVTPFTPAPLIAIMEQKGYEVYSTHIEAHKVGTYIRKQI